MVAMRISWIQSALLTVFALGAATGGAFAQQNTSATYSDWVLQCATDSATPPKKTCSISQVTQVQGKNITFSRIGIDGPVKSKPIKLIVQFPVNVSLRSPVEVQLPDATTPTLSGLFDRCVPAGCFAELELKDDVLKKFTSTEGTGKVTFKDSSGHETSVPFSFKGFHAAFDALSKEL
jgi:invasion protein IalB